MKINKKIDNVYHIEFGLDDDRANARIYRYDTGQLIKFYDIPDDVEVQFSNEHSTNGTINKRITDSMVQIPDSLLTSKDNIIAYIKYIDENSETTTKLIKFGLLDRAKPGDYVSPDEEPSFRSFVEEQLKEAKETVEKNKDYLKETIENTEKSKEYMDATDANRRTVEGLTEKNKEYATQTENNAESANTSASNASESASNASQSASNAKGSADNASVSAKEAKDAAVKAGTSESNAKEAENNINSAVTEFEQTKRESLTEIGNLTTNSKKEISDLTETKKTELNKVNDDITKNAGELKEAIVNVADAKKEEISQKGLEVLASIPEEFGKVENATLIKPTELETEINLTDSSDMNIQELHLFGRTEQKTTKGIQLLNLKDAKGGTGDGVTYTPNGDGSFKKTGTATGQAGNIWLKGDYYSDLENKTPIITLEVGKSYYIKDCAIFQGQTIIASGNGQVINVTGEKYPEGIKITGIRNTGFTLNKTYNEVIYPIVAESSTAVDWEEYTGGQPSPNPDYPQGIVSVENPTVTIQGKNLYSIFENNSYGKEQLINGVTYTKNADGSLTIKGKATTTSRYNLITNQLSAKLFARHIDEQYTLKIFGLPSNCCYEVSFAGMRYGETKNTFTNVKENFKKRYTELRIPEGVTVSTTIYPMLVLGDTITEYEPYKEIQTVQPTCELNGIDDVRDELIVRADGTGQLIQRLLEEELNDNSDYVTWYANTNTYGFLRKESKWLFRANKINIKSNKLKGITKEVGNPGTYDKNGIFVDVAGLYIKISKKYLTEYTVDALKTYLRDNPITVVGLLKEPIVTELSSEEVQKILALHTNKPNTTIWNDQDAEMQVTYVADTKSYIDNKFKELSNAIVASASEAE
nr:MAG TPA: hypothetical protein [Caudoviricetes sp.]